jgi:predicted nucleic acid-binding protein
VTLKIIDASVAVKWFVREETGKQAAMQVLDQIEDSPVDFAVPELFFNEMLSVFCRLLQPSAEVIDYMNALQDLGLHRIGNGRELLTAAADLAQTHSITGYGAVYAACAQLTSGVWITADRSAHHRLSSTSLSSFLIDHFSA